MPMFDLKDAAGVLMELNNCRKTFPNHYIRLMAFDSTRGVETIAMSFIVNRPPTEPGFGLVRQESNGRTMRYTVHSYATDKPEAQALLSRPDSAHRPFDPLGRLRAPGRRGARGHRRRRRLDPLRRDGQPLRAEPDLRPDGLPGAAQACGARRRQQGADRRAPDGAAGGRAGAGLCRGRGRPDQLPPRCQHARRPHAAADPRRRLPGRAGLQPGHARSTCWSGSSTRSTWCC
jgi:hypothetical protein